MDETPLPPPAGLPIGLDDLAARSFAAVLFDMDGTLIDSTPAVNRSWLRWAQEEDVDPALLVGMHGVPAAGIVARLLPPERRAGAVRRITAIEAADTDGITVLPGAAEALAALPPQRAAIATSCTRALARARIAATGLRAPDVVVTADDVEVGKPDPAPYLLAAARLGVQAARCLVVEDAPSGLASARAAGCASLALATTHTVADLRAARPDAVVASLASVALVASGEGVRVVAR